jgi:hypothetical protein
MTDDLRSALERWDSDPEPEAADPDDAAKKDASTKRSSAPKSKTPAKRKPKASAYLNSSPPATPRRNRKKQDTRDWLC